MSSHRRSSGKSRPGRRGLHHRIRCRRCHHRHPAPPEVRDCSDVWTSPNSCCCRHWDSLRSRCAMSTGRAFELGGAWSEAEARLTSLSTAISTWVATPLTTSSATTSPTISSTISLRCPRYHRSADPNRRLLARSRVEHRVHRDGWVARRRARCVDAARRLRGVAGRKVRGVVAGRVRRRGRRRRLGVCRSRSSRPSPAQVRFETIAVEAGHVAPVLGAAELLPIASVAALFMGSVYVLGALIPRSRTRLVTGRIRQRVGAEPCRSMPLRRKS